MQDLTVGPTQTRPVHVVVVAFHAPELLECCLAPLALRLPVTVVDNSADPVVREVVEKAGAAYRCPGQNAGFGAGVNVALKEVLAGPPVDVLLLNPDAVMSADGVHALATALHACGATFGAISPALRTLSGAAQRVLWPFPSPGRAWLEAVGLGRLNRSADFAVGTALMLRWEALMAVGLFDEQFFLYAEETDWQRRAHDLGWRASVFPGVVAEHLGGGTSADPLRREALFHAGTETYVRKWSGRHGWLAYRAAIVVGAAVRAWVLPGARGAAAAHRRHLYWRGPRRAAGLVAS